MVTFSDLITLILVFFILLFSMSQIDNVKFKAVAQSFQQQQLLDFSPSVIPAEHPSSSPTMQNEQNTKAGNPVLSKTELKQDPLDEILQEVRAYLKKNDVDKGIIANRDERGVVLVLQEQVLFDTGEAEILVQAYPFLNKIGKMLEDIPNFVKVEGHTDNRPITTFRYPSNWELSTARSSSVIRYFIDHYQVQSKRFIAVGYGDTRPSVPNTSKENLQKNRRVEIVISDPAYKDPAIPSP